QRQHKRVLEGHAPIDQYLAGAGIGGALTAFPIGGLGVLVGHAMYLPFSITLSYGFGCVISIGLERAFGRRFTADKTVPLAAGFIVGEALTALAYTLIKVVGG
ncbi:MAG: OPT/YSL family transporter, partial [Polyangiaceae bacterium]